MKKILQLSFFIFLFSIAETQAQLIADFTADTTQGCAPLDSVQFTSLSQGNPTTYSWNFGNGNTSTLQNPQASYNLPGVYTVMLTIGNGTTTSQIIKTGYITVFELPVAHFTYTPPQPCTNSIVTFTDNSIIGDGPIVNWHWGFGDGNTQTVITNSTTHSYTLPLTSVPVSVIVTDSHGCESDFDTLITVTLKPTAAFRATPLINCHVPSTVSFYDTSVTSGSVTRLWDFGDGGTATIQNPTHTYNAAGYYNVKLVIYHANCPDSLTKYQYIYIEDHKPSFTVADTAVCVGDSVHFTDTTTPASIISTWHFGDGSIGYGLTAGHVYSAPGTYTVKLKAYDGAGCNDSITKVSYITVYPQPVASFTANDTVACSTPFTVNFSSSTSGITNWSWIFGDGGTASTQNPTHTFLLPGSYTVTLIVTNSNGCKDTLIKAGYINIIPPLADFTFTPKKGCAPLTVNFTSTSTAIEPFFNYTWNYGDGSPNNVTTAGNSVHTYNNPGVYTISLIVNTINGCKDTLIKVDSVQVGIHVTPSFTISDDTVCIHDPIQFTFNTPGANSWVWFFGDGGVDSTVQNPIHQYGDTGTFTVTLVACNNGCCDTLVVPYMVTILPPKALAQVTSTCANPYTITCISQCIGADSIVWNFGDGTFVSNTTPISHTYPTRGQKYITIYAFNFTTGCMDSLVMGYIVTDPIADFVGAPLSGCYPLVVTFDDLSQDGNSYQWFFGDGIMITTPSSNPFSHGYALPGNYTVKEVITDIHGCKDSLTKVNYVQVFGPFPGFIVNLDSGCAPLSVIFSDTSHLHTTYPIVSYIWNFGDGNIDTLTTFQPVPHTYINTGNYTVTLTVTDSHGCTKTISIPNFIQASLPVAAFVVDTFSCPGKVITFNASASTAIGGSYNWLFGDGFSTTTSANTTTHTYAANGTYTVTLTLTDQNGCDSTVSHNILIEKPVADFTDTATANCGNAQVSFYNLSTGTALTSAYWDFGNGASSVIFGPTYNNYVNPGYYTVSLIITNSAGCKDTITKDSIVVVPGPIGTFDFFPKEGCSPLTVTFVANSPNAVRYVWDFADGNVLDSTLSTVTHTYTQDITAFPSLTLKAYLQGTTTLCPGLAQLSSTNDSIFVQTFSDVGILANGDSNVTVIEVSEGDQFPLSVITDITGGNTNYLWSPLSAGLSCDTCSTTYITGTGFEGYIYLEVNKNGGCNGRDSILVIFTPCDNNMEIHNIFTPNGDGNNDDFFIEHPCPENFLLTIFNRWGQEVFKTSDPVAKWDGRTKNGEFVPSGTYYWILASRDKSMKGFLQLIREKKD